jgi:APA family basic amino acid/polyamine antiporter
VPPDKPTEVGIERVLVAFEAGTYSETAMSTALKLASHKGGDVRVVVTVTVPRRLDIDVSLPQAEAEAQGVIEAARQWAGRGQRVRGQIAKVRPGEAGHRIVREAIESGAEAIVMPLPARRVAGKPFNKTLQIVLGKRPCRVIIDSAPAHTLVRSKVT